MYLIIQNLLSEPEVDIRNLLFFMFWDIVSALLNNPMFKFSSNIQGNFLFATHCKYLKKKKNRQIWYNSTEYALLYSVMKKLELSEEILKESLQKFRRAESRDYSFTSAVNWLRHLFPFSLTACSTHLSPGLATFHNSNTFNILGSYNPAFNFIVSCNASQSFY